MTTPNPRGPQPEGVSAFLALAMAIISFFALAILGLGILSSVTDTDIISVPNLGQIPGASGMTAAVVGFAAMLASALRSPRPTFVAVPMIALGSALAHLVVVWIGVFFTAGDLVVATAVAGDLVGGGVSLVVLLTAAIAGWGGIALRRTRAERPRWPWEGADEP